METSAPLSFSAAARLPRDRERVLVGCALPPKVSGVPRGAVLLAVPHVLPSAAADAVAEMHATVARLPRAPLVRVRWWGEDRPGSTLFRPTRIAHERAGAAKQRNEEEDEDDGEDGEDDGGGDSSLCMRYPVCAPLQQLIDYLRDMNELEFDVVDRDSRKKVGRSVFPFALDAALSGGARAEDAVARLRRTNALCEIHATADASVLLGYLSVNFEIEWPAATGGVSTPLKWADGAAAAPAVSVNAAVTPRAIGFSASGEPERRVQQRLSFSSLSCSSSASVAQANQPWRRDNGGTSLAAATGAVSAERLVEAARLSELLERGRALQRSMVVATANEAAEAAANAEAARAEGSDAPASPLPVNVVLASYEAMTEGVETSWEQVLEEAEQIHATRAEHPRRHDELQRRLDAQAESLGGHNALELSFESVELDQSVIDRLRRLREGSVSTRFSPVQLVVSHEHPKRLFAAPEPRDQDRWIAAFAVSSSLRKRQWHTNYSHTLPLFPATTEGGEKNGDARRRFQLQQKKLAFRVRCQPQHASPTGRRRREPSQRLDLWAEIAADELLACSDRERVFSLPLREVDDEGDGDSTKKPRRRTAARRVGSVTVRIGFATLADARSEDGGVSSDDASVWSADTPSHDHHDAHYASPIHRDGTSSQLSTGNLPQRRERQLIGVAGVPVFLGLLIDRAAVRRPVEAEPAHQSRASSPRFTLRIDYGTPAFFNGSTAKPALLVKRSARASLRRRGGHDLLQGRVNHMNAFPVVVSREFVDKLENGLLILEVWLQEQSATLASYATESLLGVVKVPLQSFRACVRDSDALAAVLRHATPCVGVDRDFPVVDPLRNDVTGHVHVRVAFGSAEQLFNLKSTLAAVVRLQSRVRGWLVRRAIRYWARFELAEASSDAHDVEGDLPIEEDARRRVAEAEEGESRDALTLTYQYEGDAEAEVAPLEHGTPIVRVEIRVEIRERFATHGQEGSVSASSLIGCEVYGHLRFHEGPTDMGRPGVGAPSSNGPRFTLWWDAQDEQLNSHFVHSLQASDHGGRVAGIQLRDVVLLLRVEPQLALQARTPSRSGAVAAAATKGAAAFDLGSVVHGVRGQRDAAGDGAAPTVLYVENVDVPIDWDGANGALNGVADVLPLRVGLKLVHGVRRRDEVHTLEGPVRADGEFETVDASTSQEQQQITTVRHTMSRTERLLPASLHLSLDLQRVSDLSDVLRARLAAARREADSSRLVRTLERAVERGVVTLEIAMSLGMGVERHPLEDVRDDDGDVASLVQDEHHMWRKRFRFRQLELDVVNGVQALPSITQGDVHVLVHAELVASLQEGSVDVQLLVHDEEQGKPIVLGDVAVPLGAILFRPSGVQGSFPVRVDDGLAGRIGVHFYIEPENDSAPDAPLEPATAVATASAASVDAAPLSPLVAEATVNRANDLRLTPLTAHQADESHYEPFKEVSLEDAVASIHDATRDIQQRLSRLASRSHSVDLIAEQEQQGAGGHGEESEDLLVLSSESKMGSAALDPASPNGSSVEAPRVEERVEADESVEVREREQVDREGGDDNESTSVAGDGDAEGEGKEDEERDGEDAMFQPITLASLGIDEIELSPMPEIESPSFTNERGAFSGLSTPLTDGDGDAVSLRHELERFSENDGSGDSDANAEEVDDWEDQGSVSASVDEAQSREGSASTVRLDGEAPDSVGPSSDDAHGAGAESREPSARVEELPRPEGLAEQHELRAESSTEAPPCEEEPPRECVVDDMEQEGSEAMVGQQILDVETGEASDSLPSVNDDEVSSTSSRFWAEPAVAEEVEVEETQSKAIDSDDDEDDDDPEDSSSDAVDQPSPRDSVDEAEDEDAADELCPRGSEDPEDRTTEEEQANETPPSQVSSADTSTQTQHESTTEDVSPPPQPPTTPTRENARPVDHFVAASVSMSYTLADSGCQTVANDLSEAECQTADAPLTAAEVQTELLDAVGAPVKIDRNARSSRVADSRATDRALQLPIDKFNVAWQLLSEIREVYIDGGEAQREPPTVTSHSIESHETETGRLDLVVVEDLASPSKLSPDTVDVSDKEEVSAHADPAAATDRDGYFGLEANKIANAADLGAWQWQWQDETMLKREVDERLQRSKRDYEEALALSQSIGSTKSWAAASAARLTTLELTNDAQQRALELSASALARNALSRRTRTLFYADTETERIARIMQGSLRHWLKEDDEDDEDENDEDDEAENDDDGDYF